MAESVKVKVFTAKHQDLWSSPPRPMLSGRKRPQIIYCPTYAHLDICMDAHEHTHLINLLIV